MTFLDKLKAKADELGLAEKAGHLADEAKKAAAQAKDKAGELADQNRDKIAGAADKVGAKINEKTDGKYADKIESAKVQVAKGVDKVAENRGAAPAAGSTFGEHSTHGADAGSDGVDDADSDAVPDVTPDAPPSDPGAPSVMDAEGDPSAFLSGAAEPAPAGDDDKPDHGQASSGSW